MFKTMLLTVFSAAACLHCSGGSVDARCESLCTIREPAVAGAYDICSKDSADLCKETCQARIKDVASLCASCLLEDADFGGGVHGTNGGSTECNNDVCTVTISNYAGATCSYTEGDAQGENACILELYPRKEVACDVDFRDVTECADVCNGSADGGN